MSYLTMEKDPYLRGWYPGLGETLILDSLPQTVREFLSDAAHEDPDFISGYLIPTLSEPAAAERICADLSDAVVSYDCELAGLGEMGALGKSFLKKVTKAVRKVHTAIEKKVMPKAVQKFEQKFKKEEQRIVKDVKKTTKKIWVKYGPIILTVVGVVFSWIPGVGPVAIAAASVLAAANAAYQKKRQADKAKQASARNAAQLQQEAAQANAQTEQQVDQFYNQNQSWFLQYGITPDKWAQLTTQQKVDLINTCATGQPPPGASAPSTAPIPGEAGSTYQPQQVYQPSVTTPSIYGSGGPTSQQTPQMPQGASSGSDWGSMVSPVTSALTQPAQPQGPQAPVEASMFGSSGMMLPIAIVAAAVVFSKGGRGGGGSRRSRRNPRRRRSR